MNSRSGAHLVDFLGPMSPIQVGPLGPREKHAEIMYIL